MHHTSFNSQLEPSSPEFDHLNDGANAFKAASKAGEHSTKRPDIRKSDAYIFELDVSSWVTGRYFDASFAD